MYRLLKPFLATGRWLKALMFRWGAQSEIVSLVVALVVLLALSLHAQAARLDIFTGEVKKPPEVQPFELATLSGEKADYNGCN